MAKRLRVLLIAEAANPDWESVPLVGWSHSRALFDLVDAHLVTQVRNITAIEKTGFRDGFEFTALDSERIARPLSLATEAIRRATGLGWTFQTAMQALPYYYFEHLLWQRFGEEIKGGRWDVVHRLTPLSPTIPSIIARRVVSAGVPFVWGPINGGLSWPPGFSDVQRREGEWLHYLRSAYRLLPGYRSTHRAATAVIVGSRASFEQLPHETRQKTVYVPENAVDVSRFRHAKCGIVSAPLRVAFVGRLVAYKGADMLIEAAADLIRQGRILLDIIGDGPEREALGVLADRLGVRSGVRIEGFVPHCDLEMRLCESDVLGFPSVREFGGGVVLEAMALGLVPVVVDYGGPGELVTDTTGFRVPIGNRNQVVAGTREVLELLARDPTIIRPMGERARARVLSKFTWQARAHQTLEIYRWVTGKRDRPDFGMPL